MMCLQVLNVGPGVNSQHDVIAKNYCVNVIPRTCIANVVQKIRELVRGYHQLLLYYGLEKSGDIFRERS